MATINNFEELDIWVLARKLHKNIFPVVNRLREKKEFRFASQMQSSSGSIMDNIAEGFERSSSLEFLNSLGISKGELGELMSQLYRCFDDKYISVDEFSNLYKECKFLSRKIASFMVYLNNSEIKGLKFKDRKL